MIRITWCHKKKPEEHFHSSWYPEGDEPFLQFWIEVLSKQYPMNNHWIESGEE